MSMIQDNNKRQQVEQLLGAYMKTAQAARKNSAESMERSAQAGMATMQNRAAQGQIAGQESAIATQPMPQYLGRM